VRRVAHRTSNRCNRQSITCTTICPAKHHLARVTCTPPAAGADDGGDEGYDNEGAAGDEDADGIEDAAAAAAKAQKQQGRRARQSESADEEATLTTAEQLRAKKGDSTLAVDPLFHSMSALFDEGGAKGEPQLVVFKQTLNKRARVFSSCRER
jgi:hypothetical protein